MAKLPDKEMMDFFKQFFATGFILMIVVALVILKFLEAFGIIKILI